MQYLCGKLTCACFGPACTSIYASDEQLAGLSTFILEHASDASTGISPSAITVASTTHRLLHSAEFYELTRLKGERYRPANPPSPHCAGC